MDTEECKAKIKGFIARFFRNHNLQDDDDIFAAGFVNSLFAMHLVLFVESEFNIVIDNEDLEMDNFRTINRLVELIKSKSSRLGHK